MNSIADPLLPRMTGRELAMMMTASKSLRNRIKGSKLYEKVMGAKKSHEAARNRAQRAESRRFFDSQVLTALLTNSEAAKRRMVNYLKGHNKHSVTRGPNRWNRFTIHGKTFNVTPTGEVYHEVPEGYWVLAKTKGSVFTKRNLRNSN